MIRTVARLADVCERTSRLLTARSLVAVSDRRGGPVIPLTPPRRSLSLDQIEEVIAMASVVIEATPRGVASA